MMGFVARFYLVTRKLFSKPDIDENSHGQMNDSARVGFRSKKDM